MNPIHLAFIAMIALIFLGPKRLPELAKTIGSGMREFRETMNLDSPADAFGHEAHQVGDGAQQSHGHHSPITAAVATPVAPVPALAPTPAEPTVAPVVSLAPVPPLAPPVALRPTAPIPPLAPPIALTRSQAEVVPPQTPDAA